MNLKHPRYFITLKIAYIKSIIITMLYFYIFIPIYIYVIIHI